MTDKRKNMQDDLHWHTSDGRSVPIGLMGQEHVINTLNGLEQGRFACHPFKYQQLCDVARRKGWKWEDYANRRLKEGELAPPKPTPTIREWAGCRMLAEQLKGRHIRATVTKKGIFGSRLWNVDGVVEEVKIFPRGWNPETQQIEPPLPGRYGARVATVNTVEGPFHGMRAATMIFDDIVRDEMTMELRELDGGDHFWHGGVKFVKNVVYGEVRRGLEERGYVAKHHRRGNFTSRSDSTLRCLVTNQETGGVCFFAADLRVKKIKR